MARGLHFTQRVQIATDLNRRTPSPEGFKLLASHRASMHATYCIYEADGALVYMLVSLRSARIDVTATSPGDAGKIALRASKAFDQPTRKPTGPPRFRCTFCWAGRLGVARQVRMVPCTEWEDARANYAASTASQLDYLMNEFRPIASGQTIVWHGIPGSGKTRAIGALASAWRDWSSVYVITDPERFLGSDAGYLMEVLAGVEEGEAPGGHRLVVLEDSGELLGRDAKQIVGQGLSRFLNVCDGFLGVEQGVTMLVTTNESMDELHPAVRRAGRCAAEIEFGPLGVEQANEWLADHGSEATVSSPTTIADLYALLEDSVPIATAATPRAVGFG